MDKVLSSLAPLSPFTWASPADLADTAHSANAVLHSIALLDLRFDLILEEFAAPCSHPLYRMNDGHPLQRDALDVRQLQLLQYGVVISEDERLVLVAAPPYCSDSGACLAASYEHLFCRSLDTTSAVAHHPLLPEYTFVAYRLPHSVDDADDASVPPAEQQQPVPLFRLVYRNVNAATGTTGLEVVSAPQFKLVAVLTSSALYYGELQKVIQYRREWHANTAANRASGGEPFSRATSLDALHDPASAALPESVAAEVRAATTLSPLCSSLARVLERFSGAEATGAADCIENGTATALSAQAGSVPTWHAEPRISDPWSFRYTRDGARLVSRIDVETRTRAVLDAWRDGEYDLAEVELVRPSPPSKRIVIVGEHSTHPPLALETHRVPCARLLLLSSHRDVPTLVTRDNEISSFLPTDAVPPGDGGSVCTVVYASPAAERLRRWVLQGLVAAEVHHIHAVLLDLDPVSALVPCVELLAEADGLGAEDDGDVDYDDMEARDPLFAVIEEARASQLRYKRALLLVCQVVMETVERFVRHSGLVWKVTVAVREPDAAASEAAASSDSVLEPSFASWCAGMLQLIRQAETKLEMCATQNTLTFDDEEAEEDEDDAVGVFAATLRASAVDQRALVAGGQQPGPSAGADADADAAAHQLALRTMAGVEEAVALYTHDATGPAAPLPRSVVIKAKAAGVKVRDDELFSLFRTFCAAAKRRDLQLPVSALTDLLLEEWSTGATKRRRYGTSPSRLVCPLDSCGVPITRVRVQRFLRPFLDVMLDYSAGERVDDYARGITTTTTQTINYAQFSMMMFSIAKM